MSGFLKANLEFGIIMLTRFSLVPRIWLIVLVVANMTSLYFIDTIEGRVVFGALVISIILMTIVYMRFGFVRLLGIGHIFWIPMVLWLWTRLDQTPLRNSTLEQWVILVIVMNAISLILDGVDVARYIKGERAPYYTLSKKMSP